MDPSVADAAAARARLLAHASVVGALAIVPLPWLPELAQVVVRRRLVDDLAKRHGVRLGSAARRELADALAPAERAVTGSAARRFVAARVARRLKVLALLPALEAAIAAAAGALLVERAFERARVAEVDMTEGEARRTRAVVGEALAAFVRPEAFEEVLRQTGALEGDRPFGERLAKAVRGIPAEALGVLVARFDHGWDSR
jgi:uncharacterized protein (DUF697 family)